MTVATTAPQIPDAPPHQPQEKFLKDYKPPSFLIEKVGLNFQLDDEGLGTVVRSRLNMKVNEDNVSDLKLDVGEFEIRHIRIDGEDQSDWKYDGANGLLTLEGIASGKKKGETFVFESEVCFKPAENKAYEGLYMSEGTYCTQCEAEGFRRITPFLDRPDVMGTYEVRIEANKERFPILLSNGNCVDKGDLDQGRHFVKYADPWPKPSYLFALVAGNLVCLEDTFTTMGGKKVDLRIYVRDGDLDRTKHAMESLKQAMKWDEEKYGREYDLDIFNIVAISDFNMGAMENKSLNLFNSKYILASEKTGTDTDFNNIQRVVAHEYFHNYTGNRVTCRDWFQLSLKEGLTVFRDQSFSQDMTSRAVKRIQDAFYLRSAQFAEDASPMAHPVRPASYITCNNFYTMTVYQKGAEVIRMLHTIVGPEGYRKGTDLYFERYDGQAVTCDDWVQTIQDANPGTNLDQFRLWYSQAGTPKVTVERETDGTALKLTFRQEIPDTRGQTNKKPMHIPILMGLVAPDGSNVLVDVGDGSKPEKSKLIHLREKSQTVTLQNVPEGSIPSLLRDFSAPVKLAVEPPLETDELAMLMANDENPFARWEAGQTMMLNIMLHLYNSTTEKLTDIPDTLSSSLRTCLKNFANVDRLLTVQMLMLPTESYMIQQISKADPVRIRTVRKHVIRSLASALESDFEKLYKDCASTGSTASLDMESQGKRALRNCALSYLVATGKDHWNKAALEQVREGGNMTAVMGAMSTLCQVACPEKETALAEFYEKWKHDTLVMDKWLMLQATAMTPNVLKDVERLAKHEVFDINNPNKCYSLLASFSAMNMHIDETGAGYKFIADKVLTLDRANPQVAARIVRAFAKLGKFTENRQELMRKECERIKNAGVSKDVYEVVAKTLDP